MQLDRPGGDVHDVVVFGGWSRLKEDINRVRQCPVAPWSGVVGTEDGMDWVGYTLSLSPSLSVYFVVTYLGLPGGWGLHSTRQPSTVP